MQTQMRTGPGGVLGFDYTALVAVFDIRQTPPDRRSDIFNDFRDFERATLKAIRNS